MAEATDCTCSRSITSLKLIHDGIGDDIFVTIGQCKCKGKYRIIQTVSYCNMPDSLQYLSRLTELIVDLISASYPVTLQCTVLNRLTELKILSLHNVQLVCDTQALVLPNIQNLILDNSVYNRDIYNILYSLNEYSTKVKILIISVIPEDTEQFNTLDRDYTETVQLPIDKLSNIMIFKLKYCYLIDTVLPENMSNLSTAWSISFKSCIFRTVIHDRLQISRLVLHYYSIQSTEYNTVRISRLRWNRRV